VVVRMRKLRLTRDKLSGSVVLIECNKEWGGYYGNSRRSRSQELYTRVSWATPIW
jgi:hypothetical protein